MESLGDNTLAAFMKSDVASRNTENSGSGSPDKPAAAKRSRRCTRKKDESDIGKYFNDSLVFSSRDGNSATDNDPPANSELFVILESPKNIATQNKDDAQNSTSAESLKCSINATSRKAKPKTNSARRKIQQQDKKIRGDKNSVASEPQNEIREFREPQIDANTEISGNNFPDSLILSKENSTAFDPSTKIPSPNPATAVNPEVSKNDFPESLILSKENSTVFDSSTKIPSRNPATVLNSEASKNNFPESLILSKENSVASIDENVQVSKNPDPKASLPCEENSSPHLQSKSFHPATNQSTEASILSNENSTRPADLKCSNQSNQTNRTTDSSIEVPCRVSTPDRCRLSSWGLPLTILRKYESRGLTKMFEWQVECLSNRDVLERGKNLVYSAPTSAGKTLVAEILMIKTVLERRKKAIFILPFVSVVREKMYYFQDLLADSGVRVEGFMGGCAPAGGFAATDVAIATIEKANSLLNQMMEEGELDGLGAVVIDELHLLGDPYRGYLLELLLTKLKYMTLREELVQVQLIGMSATLPNLELLAEWLNAELYKTDFRPVPLEELCKIGSTIYDRGMTSVRTLQGLADDPDNILELCLETISDGHSVLIFCPTKQWCESLAQQIALAFSNLGREDSPIGRTLREQLNTEAIVETLEQLKRCPIRLDAVLKKTVSFGTAFHHAGLTMDERDVIEGAFRSGALRVLTATSTLSSGVNLPARRVIIRSLMFHGKPIDTLTYRQMIGRAGRMGKDRAGESILVCKPNETKAAATLLSAQLQPIESCLEGSEPLIRALLEAVASEVAYTQEDIDLYVKCTLVCLTSEDLVRESTREAMKYLVDNELFMVQEVKTGETRWAATVLGKACLAASIAPSDGLFLFEELQKARRCFVLETELHLLYLVTPLNASKQIGQINWIVFLDLWRNVSEGERRVGQMVGVDDAFVVAAIKGTARQGKKLDIHMRFFTAMALQSLVQELPLSIVCWKYGCNRGVIQGLQQSAATFAGMITQFCKRLGWRSMELLIGQFQARLQFGVCRELLDLLRLPMLNGLRARSLYTDGITSVAELAVANELEVERALHKALPFASAKEHEGEHEADAMRRNKIRCIFVTGRDGLSPRDAAAMLVREARTLIQNELGVEELRWNQRDRPTGNVDRSENSRELSSGISERSSTANSLSTIEEVAIVREAEKSRTVETSRIDDKTKVTNSGSTESEGIDSRKLISKTVEPSKHISEPIESRQLIFEPIKSSQIIVEPIESSRLISKPGESYERTSNPIKSSEQIFKPIEYSERISKPIESTDRISEPIESNDRISKPIESRERISKPLESSQQIYKPIKSSQQTSKPAESSKQISKPTESSKQISNPKESIADMKIDSLVFESINNEDVFVFTGQVATEREKKVKTASETSTASPRVLQIRESLTKASESRSPSLFGDSLNLDSQECDILEQNVIDSLNISAFSAFSTGDANIGGAESQQKTSERRPSDSTRPNLRSGAKSQGKTSERRPSDSTRPNLRSGAKSQRKSLEQFAPGVSGTKNKSESIVWDDDSWNNTNGVVESVKQSAAAAFSAKTAEFSRQDAMILGQAEKRISGTPVLEEDYRNALTPKNRPEELRKIPQKRKFSEPDAAKSPIASVTTFAVARRLSVDSNKSDTDDVVIASQNLDTLTCGAKNRTRLKLESMRRSRSQRATTPMIPAELEEKRNLEDLVSHIDVVMPDSVDEAPAKRVQASTKLASARPAVKVSLLKKRAREAAKEAMGTEGSRSKKVQPAKVDEPQVVNVTSNWAKFNLFKRQLLGRTDVALALGCESFSKNIASIGTKIIGVTGADGTKKTKRIDSCIHGNKKLCGVAVSWDGILVHYVSFDNSQDSKVPMKDRLDLLTEIVNNGELTIRCFSAKETYKILYSCCSIAPSCKFLDPKTADWLLDPDRSDRTFNALIKEHLSEAQFLLQRGGSDIGDAGPGLNVKSAISSEFRATTEAALTWHVTNTLTTKIEKRSPALLETLKDIEMGTVALLARMELSGIGVNLKSLQELSDVIQGEMSQLEKKAYSLAGKKFNFSSSKSVAQVLGLYKGKKVSTNKAALEHCENPISSLVTSWRKLSATQIKIVFPLLRLAECSSRIYGNCVTNTATGRVSMHEPNLQNVPRDFESQDGSFVISVRMAFAPILGNVLLSADYCQLELRILAHFSKEPNLCKILRKEGDVFRNIAARWYNVAEEKIDDGMRQRTKQLCYGMIYGMGVKSLAETLSVAETEAKEFLETFMSAYPGIRKWLTQTVDEARADGYVKTLMHRQRFFPALNSQVASEKGQAERQAVNTKVQGSAADIVKKAMVAIDERMRREFPGAPIILADAPIKRKLRSCSSDPLPRGGYLVLQIHDELLYEVNAADLRQVGKIIQESMEHSVALRVPLPVKLKIGPTWGDLAEYKCQ